MRCSLILVFYLTTPIFSSAYARPSVEGSYYCLDPSKSLIADISVINFRERYLYEPCICDENGCRDEDATDLCASFLGQKADATIRFYGGTVPHGTIAEYELTSSKDQLHQVAILGSGKLGFNSEYTFYTKAELSHSMLLGLSQEGYLHELVVEERNTGALTRAQCKEASLDKNLKYVYKIFRLNEWLTLQENGRFLGSPDDIRDGFIHLASNDQVDSVIKRFFADEKVVYVAEFLTTDLGADLKWESSSSGHLYPHLYQIPLKREGVKNVKKRVL